MAANLNKYAKPAPRFINRLDFIFQIIMLGEILSQRSEMIPAGIRKKLYVDHIVLTISDLNRTKSFYSKIFGKADREDDDAILYYIGETKLFFGLPYGVMPKDDKFNADRIGLEHLAIGVRTLEDLREIERTLNSHEIRNSQIHIDKHSGKEKIWFNDPDGIRLEFFIRP